MYCAVCKHTPDELTEYVDSASGCGITPDEYVRTEEGTLDIFSGMFVCTPCYVSIGHPAFSSGTRWTASPRNVKDLNL